MSPYLPNAVIATEDRRFYSHFGVDPIGLARAAMANFRGRPGRPGRQHDHPAARQDPVPEPGAELLAQDPRGIAGAVARAPLHEGPDPRDLSEPRLSRRRHLRRRCRGAALFRQIGGEADAVRERRHRRADRGAEPAQPGARPAKPRPSARTECCDDMVEAGFITARPGRRRRRSAASPLSPNSRPGSRYFADWVAEQVREFAGTGRPRPDRAHDAGPAAAGDRRERGRRHTGALRAGYRVGQGALVAMATGRRGAGDGRRARLRTTASSTARPRRSASPARRSSRSSTSPGSKPGCVRRTASSTRRSASATGSRTIIPTAIRAR